MIEIRHQEMITTKDTKRAYDDLYLNGKIGLSDSFYLWIIKLLQPKPGKKFVDISCGRGRLVQLALRQHIDAIGLDFSSKAILECKSSDPSSRWIISDGEKISLKGESADYITHIGNLEHYQDPSAGIREVSRLLKADGIACILLPNGFSLLGNIKYVAFKGKVYDDGQPLQRYNTRIGWEKLLNENGLQVIRAVKYEHYMPRTRQDWITHLRKPSRILHWLVSWMVPLNLSNCFLYFCRRVFATNGANEKN